MQTVVSRLWQTPSVAMFRSGALRNLNNARTISNCLIRTHCLSKSDFTVSAVVLRERRSDQDRYSKYSRYFLSFCSCLFFFLGDWLPLPTFTLPNGIRV